MRLAGRRLFLLLLLTLPVCASGCFGLSQNPSYFPHWVLFGDVIPTHAKPIGPSYYANFDPKAVRLEVRPLQGTNQVRTQHVVLATVYDGDGPGAKPLRNRRVEWMVEGVGNLIEVDESGFLPGRGYKTSNKHGVSYTSRNEHRLTRGNQNPADDFMVRPGQSWCVVSSAVEGDTYVTVYAPGIHDWEKGRKTVVIRWVDAAWEFPPPATARGGGEHVLTTKIFKATDRQPLAGYRVRYKIIGGPPAFFLPGRTSEFTATSDLAGNAQATLAQAGSVPGINKIAIEIIRPPDPSAPSGSGITLAQGETTVEWLAPSVVLEHKGPSIAVLGQEIAYTAVATNAGRIESRSMTLSAGVPPGLQYVRSQPPAFVQGNQLVWALGILPPGQSHTIQAVFKTVQPGNVRHCITMQTEEGQKDEKCVDTLVGTAALKVAITGPATGVVGLPVNYTVTVTNPGNGPLERVLLTAQLDQGLEGNQGARTLNTTLENLQGQETRTVQLAATPRLPGRLGCKVIATAGTLTDQADHFVVVGQPQLNLRLDGPTRLYKDRTGNFLLRVGNPGDSPITNVIVRDKLPAELTFLNANLGGQLLAGEVVWNLGTLGPREEKTLTLGVRGQTLTKQAVQTVVATADGGLRKDAQAVLEIFGVPTLRTEMVDRGDPAEVGKKVTYILEITNTGSLSADGIEVVGTIPPELRYAGARAPAKDDLRGNVLSFGKLDNLQPGQKLTYEIEMEAIRAGDARFRVEVRSAALEAGPTIEEESTTIFDPGRAPAGGVPAPPPPPPPPGL